VYGKIFDSIYDGTLYGHWEAIVTMQQLIVLATPDGLVDMTPQAMSARTSIPLEIILKGLDVLSKPDPYTRTPGEDGKRIVLIDDHRPWGWRLVNHGKYMRLRDMKEKREADRRRIAEKRNKNSYVAIESQMSQMSPTHTHTQTNTQKEHVEGSRKNGAHHERVDDSPIVETLPILGGSFEVHQSLVAELEPLCPAVDIPVTLREMKLWLVGNPSRMKTRKGVRRFISGWLTREQQKWDATQGRH